MLKRIETTKKINLQFFAEDGEGDVKTPPAAEEKKAPEFSTAEEFKKAYKELKDNSVDKALYEESQKQVRDLTKAVVDGVKVTLTEQGKEEKESDLKELAKSMFETGLDNLEYTKRVLKYRKAAIDKTGHDPFVAVNSEDPDGDAIKAQNVADVMEQCVEQSNGSPQLFTALFGDRIKETPLAGAKAKARGGRA